MRLAPYAMRDELTEGRRYPEESHPYRSEYQRDRDRIVHTKAFRRLENKTQVFDPNYSDHFRNRLTHTIEVSQITRTISPALELNTDLCEVLALSHDIGHPPFSHEGERVLDQLMKEHGSGFEHNLHALRIVEDFEEKYAAFRGLNLTFEVREGIIKHSRNYTPEDKSYVDIQEYRLDDYPPLEAQLIDLADEIAYNTADLDDGYDSGFLTLGQMVEQVELFRTTYGRIEKRHSGTLEKLKVSETVRELINILVTSLVTESRAVLKAGGIDSVEKVRRAKTRLLGFDEKIAKQNRELKEFLHRNLYDHSIMREPRKKAQSQIENLFHYYLDNPQRLPESHSSRISILGLERIVCDYIAGMTDKYAQARHAEISGRT
ncbi:MAG: deoxyguanosinetriphosphate triphosphohydrolase [Acidobacteriota bacterium]